MAYKQKLVVGTVQQKIKEYTTQLNMLSASYAFACAEQKEAIEIARRLPQQIEETKRLLDELLNVAATSDERITKATALVNTYQPQVHKLRQMLALLEESVEVQEDMQQVQRKAAYNRA